LALKWYPDKNPLNRVNAQRIFSEITHAFAVLANQARRDHYDQIIGHKYTKEEALRAFEKFFNHSGIEEEEKPFFEKYYPNRKQNLYELLGLRRDATP